MIDIRKSLGKALEGHVLTVDCEWVKENEKEILEMCTDFYYDIEGATEEDVELFMELGYSVRYEFGEEEMSYAIVNEKLGHYDIVDVDKYEKIDWEILIPYIIELGIIKKVEV